MVLVLSGIKVWCQIRAFGPSLQIYSFMYYRTFSIGPNPFTLGTRQTKEGPAGPSFT